MKYPHALSALAATAWLATLASSPARAADAPAAVKPVAAVAMTGSKPTPSPLVLVPEPRPAPMLPQAAAVKAPVAPQALTMPSMAAPPAFYAPPRPVATEMLPQLPSGRAHTVAAGESLDRVIQKTMADSPLKTELVRQAFVQLNPQAFPDGRVVRLKAGTVLQIPDAAQLVRQTLLPALEGAEAAAIARNGTAQADDKRRWVRFP